MKVSCPACDSKYTIADEKVLGRKVKVRCKSCGGQILINGTIPPPAPGADEDAQGTSAKDGDKSSPTSAPGKSAPSQAKPEPDDGITWSVNVSETDERSLTTHEVVAGFLSGEFSGEVFVWHDGMADWSAIPDVPQLAAAIDAAKKKSASKPTPGKPFSNTGAHPKAPASEPPPSKQKVLPSIGKGGKTQESPLTSAQPEGGAKKAAARAAGAKRPQSAHDLFAGSSSAGSETDVPVSDDDDAAQMKTGARNENSVLFSLDALKAGITAAPTQQQSKSGPGKKAPATPRKKLEDLMGAAGAPLATGPIASPLMLNANQSLLTAPAPPPPKPKPEPVVAAVPVPMSAAEIGFAREKEKTKRMLIGVIAAIVVVGAVAGIAIAMTKKPPPVVVVAPVVPSAVAVVTPPPAQPVAPATDEAKPAESAGATASSAAPQKATAVAQVGIKSGSGSAAKADPKTEPKKEPKKEEPAVPTSSGVGSFNTGAASQALSVAASQTSICKKPDGPTGAGKVQVTFAPSGRATTANVVSGPYGGTAVGGCISGVFKRAKVPPFSGDPVTVSKSFSISQ